MVDLKPFYAALILLLASSGMPAGAEESVLKGESKALGLKFESESADWCAQEVRIRLDAMDPKVLNGQSEEFQQAAGKIRAVIDGGCPYVRTVSFAGHHAKKLVSYGEMMQAGQWVYRQFPLTGQEPSCQGGTDAEVCQRRWLAFKLMRHFILDERFKELELTRYLKADDGPDLEFTYGTVKGRVIVRPIPQDNARPDSKTVVEAQIRKQAKSCQTETRVTNTDTLPNGFFSQGVACKDAGSTYVHFLGGVIGDNFVMLAATDTAGTQKGEEFAWRMSAAADHAFPTGEDRSALGGIECGMTDSVADSGSLAIAIELVKVSDTADGIEFAVRDGDRVSADRWRMTARSVPQDVRQLLSATSDGPWVAYRTVRTPQGVRFSSTVYVRDSAACRSAFDKSTVDAAAIPMSAVKAFAKMSGIGGDRDDADLRNELRIWAATQF